MRGKKFLFVFWAVLSLLVLPIFVSAQEVLWEQTEGGGFVDDQDYLSPLMDTYDSFVTDDFTNSEAWNIGAIFIPGDGNLINASALHWQIYADSGGLPNGNPSGGGEAPLWSLSLPPTDPQVSIAGGDVTLSLTRWLHLQPGTYWLFFYPSLDHTSYGYYYWFDSSSTNGNVAQWINPGGGWTLGTSFIPISPTKTAQHDMAFRLEGLTGSSIITPRGGESLPSGSIYKIQWAGPGEYFRLRYSMNKGVTWRLLADQYADWNFNWWLPTPPNNMSKCLLKVEGFNAKGALVSSDISEQTFSIDVVKLTSPKGGETFTSGENRSITWETNSTKSDVTKVILSYTVNGGATWKPIGTLSGNPGIYNDWIVPSANSSNCKVKVVLMNARGAIVGSDVSDTVFTINP